MKMTKNRFGVALTVALAVTGLRGAEPEKSPAAWETPQQHDARMQWFREAKFGMFIHWGLYSQLAGEWKDQTIMGGGNVIHWELIQRQHFTMQPEV